jgi:hypothetical protein
MALAVLAAGALRAVLPPALRNGDARWAYIVLVAILLGILIIGDPGRIDRDKTWLRVLTGSLIGLITVVNAVAAVRLLGGIIRVAPFSDDANVLLASGGAIWLTNVIAFGLWYWDLDRGGPAARARGPGGPPAFVFPEMTNPEFAGAGWVPTFLDYLHLSFSAAMAFSPTDVSAIKPWAKLMMMAEEAVSLVVAVLVVARAVNILRLPQPLIFLNASSRDWPPAAARPPVARCRACWQAWSGRGRAPAVQRLLELRLAFLGQRGLQHRAAVLAHRLDGLVRGHLLHHQEQRGRARRDHAADLVLELLVDAGLGDLAHQRAHAGAYGHAEHRDEEQQAEQQPPEHAPGRPGADRVVTGVHVVLALLIADDDRDRVRLDDQIPGQPPCLFGRFLSGGLVRVTNRDQISHGCSLSVFRPAGVCFSPSSPRSVPAHP